ncbi:MAG: LLM class F420-dependent oxidoreductase [Acidimicrobiales bacterium]|nr:LLM class F420-dependent oxidoreductase [Acidimicrobiales bacterium]
MLPAAHATWEEDGTIEDIAQIAIAADQLGFDHLTCSEHVVVPVDIAPARGSRYWDPLATFGYLAAVTAHVRLVTAVVVLGYHHPLAVAKRYGTLDQIAGGRLVLGVGVGSLEEEFELLGASFADRGARGDDAIRALRASLSVPRPEYAGPYYRYEGLVLDPCARPGVPIWIGGRTARSLRRAVELGDGWSPFGLRADEIAALVTAARATAAWSDRERPLDVVLQNGRPFDPSGDPEGTAHAVDRLIESGATGLQLRLVHHSRAHYIEQLEAFVALAEASASRPGGDSTTEEHG